MREIRFWQTDTYLSDADVKDYIWRQKGITYAASTLATYPTDLKAYFHFTAESAYEEQNIEDLTSFTSKLDLKKAKVVAINYTTNPELNGLALCPPGQYQADT